MPLKILSQIPKRDNWELLCHHFFPNYPDGLLASTLIGACALAEFLDFLQNEALQAYPKMLVQSYILYHNLIKSIKSSHTDSMQYHIEQIKQSFLERAKFDDFPPWDGAKESNHLSVDFRLVSILYYSIVNKTMSLSQVTAEMLVEQHVLPPPQIGNWNILVDKK